MVSCHSIINISYYYFILVQFMKLWVLIKSLRKKWMSVRLKLQDYKAYTCPALGLKKEPRVSNKDINGLMNVGAYTSETRSWRDKTLPCAAVVGRM